MPHGTDLFLWVLGEKVFLVDKCTHGNCSTFTIHAICHIPIKPSVRAYSAALRGRFASQTLLGVRWFFTSEKKYSITDIDNASAHDVHKNFMCEVLWLHPSLPWQTCSEAKRNVLIKKGGTRPSRPSHPPRPCKMHKIAGGFWGIFYDG